MAKSNRQAKKDRKKREQEQAELNAKVNSADDATKRKYAMINDYNEYVNGKFNEVILQAKILQYDLVSDELINEYQGTFKNIFKRIEDFPNYYYRFKKYQNHSRKIVEDYHFNVLVKDESSLKITEEDIMNRRLNYYVKNLAEEVDGQKVVPNRLLNDLGYLYYDYKVYLDKFRNRDTNLFNEALNSFVAKHNFREIKDLNELNNISGIYILVIDEYHSFYLDDSDDMKTSILNHWSRSNYYSAHGIDLFKAKDTTRIYALPLFEAIGETFDRIMMDEFFNESLNRNSGGKYSGFSIHNLNNQYKEDYDYHALYQMVNQNKNLFL